MLKKLTIGAFYDRLEISNILGGSPQTALRNKNGKVVAGCFDPAMNPDAPEIILVGRGRDKEKFSKKLVEEKYPIPMFLKRDSKKYEFVGFFLANRYVVNREEIQRLNTTRKRNSNDIAAILYFDESQD